MSQEEKDRKLKKIEEMRKEQAPSGLFAKVKYYVKRYWYIALPVHGTCCALYFGGIYFAIKRLFYYIKKKNFQLNYLF